MNHNSSRQNGFTLACIAHTLDLELRGDPDIVLTGLASLDEANGQHLSFLSGKKYLPKVACTAAAALILHPDWLHAWPGSCLLSEQPYASFARATHLFDNRPQPSRIIHPTVVLNPSAHLGENVTIDAGAVIEADVSLGDNVWIGANVYVGHGCQIGNDTRVHPGVVVYYGVVIGSYCTVHSNTIIGADGFGFAKRSNQQGWIKTLQLGGVRVGDYVEIGASATIDRGSLHDTELSDGVIIDNQVHIAHNVSIGARTAIAACTGIAGSTTIGADCTFGGMCGVVDNITLADGIQLNVNTIVSRSLVDPGVYASGIPVESYRKWNKNAARFKQLSTMAKRLAILEKQLAILNESQVSKGENEREESS